MAILHVSHRQAIGSPIPWIYPWIYPWISTEKSVDIDVDMDGKFHIHGKPDVISETCEDTPTGKRQIRRFQRPHAGLKTFQQETPSNIVRIGLGACATTPYSSRKFRVYYYS